MWIAWLDLLARAGSQSSAGRCVVPPPPWLPWLVVPALGAILLYSLDLGLAFLGKMLSNELQHPPSHQHECAVQSQQEYQDLKPLSHLAMELEINTSPGAHPQAAEDFPISP